MEVESQLFQTTELDLPVSTAGILLLLGSVAVLAALTVRTALRDSRFLNARDRAILLIPRMLVLALVLLIVLNPQRRTQLSRIEKSRVGILLDTSLSMAWPAGDPVATAGKFRSINRHSPDTRRCASLLKSLIASGVLVGTQQEARSVSLHVRFITGRSMGDRFAEDAVRFVDVDARIGRRLQPRPATQADNTCRWIRKTPITASTISDPRSLAEVEFDHPAARCGNANWRIALSTDRSDFRANAAAVWS